jgi:DNA topoisomerase-3
MEGAGKMVDDEELKAAMAGRGLGTPATRAQIIENLIGEQYMHREGRELIPTAKAFSLMTLLNGLGINELTQPELTGDWEWKLGRIEKGEFTRAEFMREIAEMTRHMVERAKQLRSRHHSRRFRRAVGALPEMRRPDSRDLQEIPVRQLRLRAVEDRRRPPVRTGRNRHPAHRRQIGPLTGFRNKMGRSLCRRHQAQRQDGARIRLRPGQGG